MKNPSNFKKGDRIAVILYSGSSSVKAEATLKFLDYHKLNNKPVPLDGTPFHICVTAATIITHNKDAGEPLYKVALKGEIL